MKSSTATIKRHTHETQIDLTIRIAGTGISRIDTDIGFLTHMLTLFSKHSLCDLTLTAKGDVHIDDHHLIEDVGICLGQAIFDLTRDKTGIARYGHSVLPMDEVLCVCAIDLSGRYAFETNYRPVREKVHDFSTEMMPHFFRSLATCAMMNIHIHYLNPGNNEHHRLEAAFKAFARALKMALSPEARALDQLPTTKGML